MNLRLLSHRSGLGLALIGCLLQISFLPVRAALNVPLMAIDCREASLPLNPLGVNTLVLFGPPSFEKELREQGGLFDPLLVRKDFRLIVVVDLSRHPGRFLPGTVRAQMRSNLARKRNLLRQRGLAAGDPPDYAMYSVPDLNGTVAHTLGWSEPKEALRAVYFGPDGTELHRWNESFDAEEALRLLH